MLLLMHSQRISMARPIVHQWQVCCERTGLIIVMHTSYAQVRRLKSTSYLIPEKCLKLWLRRGTSAVACAPLCSPPLTRHLPPQSDRISCSLRLQRGGASTSSGNSRWWSLSCDDQLNASSSSSSSALRPSPEGYRASGRAGPSAAASSRAGPSAAAGSRVACGEAQGPVAATVSEEVPGECALQPLRSKLQS